MVMNRWNLANHDLVDSSLEQLTHKQVQRACSGRRLTLKMMMKIARALNIAIYSRLDDKPKERFIEYLHRDLFSYSKGFDPNRIDPNEELLEELSSGQS